jgi:hypothetical protein
MSARIRRRRARTSHPCSWGACRTITPGELYLVHTAYPGPGDDAGWATAAGCPVRLAECSDCATRYGRGELLVEATP